MIRSGSDVDMKIEEEQNDGGVTKDHQLAYIYTMADVIIFTLKMGHSVKVEDQRILGLALTTFHFYLRQKGFESMDRHLASVVCFYLAVKAKRDELEYACDAARKLQMGDLVAYYFGAEAAGGPSKYDFQKLYPRLMEEASCIEEEMLYLTAFEFDCNLPVEMVNSFGARYFEILVMDQQLTSEQQLQVKECYADFINFCRKAALDQYVRPYLFRFSIEEITLSVIIIAAKFYQGVCEHQQLPSTIQVRRQYFKILQILSLASMLDCSLEALDQVEVPIDFFMTQTGSKYFQSLQKVFGGDMQLDMQHVKFIVEDLRNIIAIMAS